MAANQIDMTIGDEVDLTAEETLEALGVYSDKMDGKRKRICEIIQHHLGPDSEVNPTFVSKLVGESAPTDDRKVRPTEMRSRTDDEVELMHSKKNKTAVEPNIKLVYSGTLERETTPPPIRTKRKRRTKKEMNASNTVQLTIPMDETTTTAQIRTHSPEDTQSVKKKRGKPKTSPLQKPLDVKGIESVPQIQALPLSRHESESSVKTIPVKKVSTKREGGTYIDGRNHHHYWKQKNKAYILDQMSSRGDRSDKKELMKKTKVELIDMLLAMPIPSKSR